MDFIVPLFVIAVVSALVIFPLTRGLDPTGRIRAFVWVALLLRVVFAVMFELVPAARIFHEDASGYENVGLMFARRWHGEGPPLPMEKLTNYGYFYWNAVLFYLFGPYRLHASLFNALTSCATALLIYRMTRELFVEVIARRALYLALFFPSMILWSSIAVKDTLMVFLLVVCMTAVLRLKKRTSMLDAGLLVGAMAAILTIRFYMFYMVALAIGGSFLVFKRGGAKRGLLPQFMLLGITAAAFVALGLRGEASQNLQWFNFAKVSTLRSGLASTASSGWHGDVDVSSPAKAIAFMPLGVSFLLLSPFPWQFTSLRALLTLPEMLVWWSLTFAWLRGVRYSLRSFRADLMPLVVFTVIVTLAYSTVHGNVGVAFRQRSQVMIFLFIFAAVGQYLKRCRAHGLPNAAVEAAWWQSRPTQAASVPSAASTPQGAPRVGIAPVMR